MWKNMVVREVHESAIGKRYIKEERSCCVDHLSMFMQLKLFLYMRKHSCFHTLCPITFVDANSHHNPRCAEPKHLLTSSSSFDP